MQESQPERKRRRGCVRRLEEVSGGESVCDRERMERKSAGLQREKRIDAKEAKSKISGMRKKVKI